jgi:hypothetical protein
LEGTPSNNAPASSSSKPGSLKDSQPINDEVKKLATDLKADIEKKAGRSFKTFNPKELYVFF